MYVLYLFDNCPAALRHRSLTTNDDTFGLARDGMVFFQWVAGSQVRKNDDI